MAERVNGILEMEWLNDEHFQSIADARIRNAQVIDIYNNERPHLSLNYATPNQTYSMTGEQVKKWKNYHKSKQSHKSDDNIILSLTTDVRNDLRTLGLCTQKSI